MILECFAKNVRYFREKLKISQEKFALSIDMDRTYYSAVENARQNISLKNVEKIANGLNVPIFMLFCEEQDGQK